MGDQREQPHVLYHEDVGSRDGELHEEVRVLDNGDIVVESWFYDLHHPSDEVFFQLAIPAAQTGRFLDALNAALRVGGLATQEDPIEALKSLPIFDFDGRFGNQKLRRWLDGTNVEYEWKQTDVLDRNNHSFRKGPLPVTQLPSKLGHWGQPLRPEGGDP